MTKCEGTTSSKMFQVLVGQTTEWRGQKQQQYPNAEWNKDGESEMGTIRDFAFLPKWTR